MEDDSSWLLEDWNGTDHGDFGSRCRVSVYRMDCLDDEECRMSLSDCLDDEESCLDGWLSFAWIDVVLFGSSFLLLWGSIMVVLSSQHLRCEMSGQFMLHHYFERVMNTKRKMFCITTVEFLMKIVKKCFFPSGFRFATQLVDSRCVVFCRVLPCRPSILSDRLVLRWISDHSPSMHRAWILVSVSFESVRLFSRIVFIAVSSVGFFQPSVIGDVGPYCGPSGVAATVRVDARFQGTIVRGLGYPSCRPSPCGPRRQFDIGDSCVRSKKQLQLFGSCIYIFI